MISIIPKPNTIKDKKSPLIGEIEKSLVDKITNIYKELL